MCQWGAIRNPLVGYRIGLSPTRASPPTPNLGVEKSPFQIAAKRLEIDENTNRARLIKHFIVLNLCPKPRMSERRSNTICAVVGWPDHHCNTKVITTLN